MGTPFTASEARRVIVAAGDAERAGALAAAFSRKGLIPTLAFDALQLLECIDVDEFDLAIFDLRLVGRDADNLLRSIRERMSGPLMGLSHGDADDARLAALGVHSQVPARAPADEIATAGAMLLGVHMRTEHGAFLVWGPLELDTARRQAFWKGRPLAFTKLQFRLLAALVRADGAVVSSERLSHLVYGNSSFDNGDRILAHVRRIRKKIEPVASLPTFLLTVRGEGFRLADDPMDQRAVS
jgi:DNA-binding response OmpR family regulator